MSSSRLLAALLPALVVGVAFVVYCEVDIARSVTTRALPKWAWAVLCVVSVPFGAVAYLLFGRAQR